MTLKKNSAKNMPNDTTKISASDKLSRYQFRNREGNEKSSETTEANKPAKPDAASTSNVTELLLMAWRR